MATTSLRIEYTQRFNEEAVLGLLKEQRQGGFLGYAWFQVWLQQQPTAPIFAYFYSEQVLVGFCCIHITRVTRYGLTRSVGFLHQTGRAGYDQIWLEHNNIVCQPNVLSACINKLLSSVFSALKIAELRVSMADTQFLHTLSTQTQLRYDAGVHESFIAPLQAHDTTDTLLSRLSKNTREQLRRAIRKTVATFGEIRLTVANTQQDKREFLSALAALHRKKWCDTPEGSGFDNPIFVNFHQTLINESPQDTLLLQLEAGSTVLGYAYYLLTPQRALFYCSGINQWDVPTSCKPGYLLHLYAMAYMARAGMEEYDFLAGDGQYKASLSQHRYQMHSLQIFAPSCKGKLLHTAMVLRDKWRAYKEK